MEFVGFGLNCDFFCTAVAASDAPHENGRIPRLELGLASLLIILHIKWSCMSSNDIDINRSYVLSVYLFH